MEIHRIMDANMNRAAEALRVIEEYARFALCDSESTARLKAIRHGLDEFAVAAGIERRSRLAARDALNDPGRPDAGPAAGTYPGIGGMLAANFSRLFEALRVLSEYSRAGGKAGAAAAAERLRFEAYSAESSLMFDDRRRRITAASLYFILSGEPAPASPAALAAACARGGADVVQLRGFKVPDRDLLVLAREVCAAASGAGALFIMNDRVDVALACGADGVHLGRNDMGIGDARGIVGSRLLIGASVRSAEEAAAAFGAGADYVGIGTVYPSALKPDRKAIGPGEAARASSSVQGPVFPIGGIGAGRIAELAALGIRRACVSSDLMSARDPMEHAAALKAALAGPRGSFSSGREPGARPG